TAQHLAALQQFGVLPEHREDFAPVRALLAQGR
ncbi:ribonuclease HII, partial [Neisseria weixii]